MAKYVIIIFYQVFYSTRDGFCDRWCYDSSLNWYVPFILNFLFVDLSGKIGYSFLFLKCFICELVGVNIKKCVPILCKMKNLRWMLRLRGVCRLGVAGIADSQAESSRKSVVFMFSLLIKVYYLLYYLSQGYQWRTLGDFGGSIAPRKFSDSLNLLKNPFRIYLLVYQIHHPPNFLQQPRLALIVPWNQSNIIILNLIHII